MSSTWLIRAGEDSRLAPVFESLSKVALGWPDVSGLEDLRLTERAAIAAAIRATGKSTSVAALDAAELVAFRDDVTVGDVVITPDSRTRQVLVGEVTDEYDYSDDASVGDYHHSRSVKWLGRADRDVLDTALRSDTNFRRTLKRLTANQSEWLAVAERLRNGDSMLAPRKAVYRRGRVEAIEAERVASERKCEGCGYMKRSTQFNEGNNLCVDCR